MIQIPLKDKKRLCMDFFNLKYPPGTKMIRELHYSNPQICETISEAFLSHYGNPWVYIKNEYKSITIVPIDKLTPLKIIN